MVIESKPVAAGADQQRSGCVCRDPLRYLNHEAGTLNVGEGNRFSYV